MASLRVSVAKSQSFTSPIWSSGIVESFDVVCKAESGVNLVEEADNVLDLVLHLIPCHEDVRVILSEAAYAEQAVQSAGKLVTVNKTELAHAQRAGRGTNAARI